MGFVVDRVSLGQMPVETTRFTPVIIIPPLLQTHFHVHVVHYQKEKRSKPGNFIPLLEIG